MSHKRKVTSQPLAANQQFKGVLESLARYFNVPIDLYEETIAFANISRTGKTIPDMSFAGCTLERAGVHGTFPPSDDVAETLRDALTVSVDFAVRNRIEVGVAFEEKSSKQSRAYHDAVSIGVSRGRTFFCYSQNGSVIATDPAYAFDAFGGLPEAIELPIVIEGDAKHYTFEHKYPGKVLEVQGGPSGANPVGFRCEVDWTIEQSVEKLFQLLSLFSSGRQFAETWLATTPKEDGYKPGNDRAREVLAFATSGALQFKKFTSNINLVIDDLDGLVELGKQCVQKDSASMELFGFEQPNGRVGEARMSVDKSGYTITLELAEEIDLDDVTQKTGVVFVQ